MKVETIIQAFYEQKLQKTSDFENALKECSKEGLIDFIMSLQCKQVFNSFQDKGNYNPEFVEIFGEVAE